MQRFSLSALLVCMCVVLSLGVACSSYNAAPSATPSIITPAAAAATQATSNPPARTATSTPATASATAAQTAVTQAAAPSTCPDAAAPIPESIPGVPAVPAGATTVKTASGLQYIDLKPGTGAVAQKGQTATVDYSGWLPDGKLFDASKNHGGTLSFPLGGGQVIRGWDEGVANMKVGGQRRLIIPPNLAYGPKGGGGGIIPPCATLIFDVTLMGTK